MLAVLAALWLAACTPSCKSGLTVTYEYADAGPHPPPLPVAPATAVDITLKEAVEVYDRFRGACIRKDAQMLWDLLSDEIHRASERRAATFRTDPGVLRSIYHHDGPPDAFTAFKFHRVDAFEGVTPRFDDLTLCARANAWSMEIKSAQPHEYVLLVRHPKAMEAGFFLRRDTSGRIRVRATWWNDAPSDPRYWLTYRFVYGEEDAVAPVAVNVTREQALEVYERFREACARKDARAVWAMLADATREDLDAAAARLRELGSADLRSVFGYTGALAEFGAFEVLRGDFKLRLHMCSDAESWSISSEGQRGPEYLLAVESGTGRRMELYLERSELGVIRARPAPWFSAR